jgi:hypothetical protein
MVIKAIKFFSFKGLLKCTQTGGLVWKWTIWQTWSETLIVWRVTSAMRSGSSSGRGGCRWRPSRSRRLPETRHRPLPPRIHFL